jgi:hypothetical protein
MIRVDITALSCGEALSSFPSFKDREQTVGQQDRQRTAAIRLIQIKARRVGAAAETENAAALECSAAGAY